MAFVRWFFRKCASPVRLNCTPTALPRLNFPSQNTASNHFSLFSSTAMLGKSTQPLGKETAKKEGKLDDLATLSKQWKPKHVGPGSKFGSQNRARVSKEFTIFRGVWGQGAKGGGSGACGGIVLYYDFHRSPNPSCVFSTMCLERALYGLENR